MKKQFSKKLLLLCSGFFFMVYGLIYACGPDYFYDWYYNSNSNFTPEAFVDQSYAPLFLSTDIFYGIGFDNGHNSRFNSEIKTDWNAYLDGRMDSATVKHFLIESNLEEVVSLAKQYKRGGQSAVAELWGNKVDFNDKKVKSFLDFLIVAKVIEVPALRVNAWSYEEDDTSVPFDSAAIVEAERRFDSATDSFLKNRYWFQVMKGYFYAEKYQAMLQFWNRTSANVVKNTLYYRAMGYCAGVYYKQNDFSLANYTYSQIFDKCPEMRVVAAYSFHPQEQADWQASLGLAESNEEKAALWALHGYYNDTYTAIVKIYELVPASPHLNYLLTRIINEQENLINGQRADAESLTNEQVKSVEFSSEIGNLITRIASEGLTDKPYLWNMANGYTQLLKGDHKGANATFKVVERSMPESDLVKKQLRLLRFLNQLYQVKKGTIKVQKELLADLRWLYVELPESNSPNFRFQNASEKSKAYLSRLFKAEGNDVFAELLVGDDTFYDNPEHLQAMKRFLSSDKKSEFEILLQTIYSYKLDDVVAFEAIQLTYENKVARALDVLKQSDSLKLHTLLGNPFNGKIQDCHDCDHASYQKTKYSRQSFLETIALMQEKLEDKEDVYNNSLLLGNAFYNITHYGNARTFYESGIVGSGSSPDYFRTTMQSMILDCSIAKKYYQQALSVASSKEDRAKCTYMIAKCQRNEWYNNSFYYKDFDSYAIYQNEKKYVVWDAFKNLKKEYSDTQYYQEVISSCGYFAYYVNQ